MKPVFSLAGLASFAAAALCATALQAQVPAPASGAPDSQPARSGPTVSAGKSTSSAYILGRDDVVEVGLLGRTDFGGRSRIQADGSIQLPLVGKIQAAEHTTSELSDTVRASLKAGGYFADPVVTVEVVSYASRYVVVLGAVGTPGLVPINRQYRVSEIMARVGGVRENAADYVIVRSEDGGERRLLIRDLATGDTAHDPYVKAGDKIYSPQADLFYIYGAVNSPGGFPLTDGMTVRMALARGGGLTESGSDKKVTVNRGGKKAHLDAGDKLQAGDVLQVGEKLF